MNISAVTGVAAAFEGSRVAGQQQAASTSTADQTRRDNDRNAEEADLKQTDTVTQNGASSHSSETTGRHVNIIA
jgi:nitric oxide reductase activation protein